MTVLSNRAGLRNEIGIRDEIIYRNEEWYGRIKNLMNALQLNCENIRVKGSGFLSTRADFYSGVFV